ncbi:MAG: L-arabinose isomerase [Ruminiclostridium sp.]
MMKVKDFEFWFITGSQHLYGPETLKQVAEHSKIMVEQLNLDSTIPYNIVFKPIVTTSDEILKVFIDANSDGKCAGIITWMHTFSPSKMWIAGFSQLQKPLLHFHTQFNKEIPWSTIDMDFMNLNQSAHGDREHGFIGARMRIARKVIAGYWEDGTVRERIGAWERTAVAYIWGCHLKVVRFGDNMRDVAVTEGDKVEAQIKFGWSVDAYGVGDLVAEVNKVTDEQIEELLSEYQTKYDIAPDSQNGEKFEAIREQARIELGMKAILEETGSSAFTTNFQDLHGLKQLPGLASQDLMSKGFGFGGEGDWKTSALTNVMKVMADNKGTSFMEDYTYNLVPGNELNLGAHMLEVCPTIAATKPRLEVHPLGIGGKADPARIVFDGASGHAVCASLIDMGNRFRLIINEVEAIQPTIDMPKLPVARVLWRPEPSLQVSAEAWIYAGGAHHTVFSYNVTAEQLIDWAEMAGIEYVLINKDTNLLNLRNELRWNEIAWKLL